MTGSGKSARGKALDVDDDLRKGGGLRSIPCALRLLRVLRPGLRRVGRGLGALRLVLRRLLERRLLPGAELDGDGHHRLRDDVVVLEDVDARREAPVGEEVEELSLRVERRVDGVVEAVGHRHGLPGRELVKPDAPVAVRLDLRVRDPGAVGRPGVVGDLPRELVVGELMRLGDLRPLLRRHVDDEESKVLVAEEELRAVGRPLGVVGGPVEVGREGVPGPVAGDVLSRRAGTRRSGRRRRRPSSRRARSAGSARGSSARGSGCGSPRSRP